MANNQIPQFLYRFRSIDRVLKDGELINQEIYFSDIETLNDPMEGFKDIFWQGDIIAWGNLIKHYLICLEHICSLSVVGGSDYPISEQKLPVCKTIDNLPTQKYKDICTLFFKNTSVKQYIDSLSNRSSPIRRNELFSHLLKIHFYALDVVFTVYENHSLIPKRPFNPSTTQEMLTALLKPETINAINALEKEHAEDKDAVEMIFGVGRTAHMEFNLLFASANQHLPNFKNKRFIMNQFIDRYLDDIEGLMYPTWYTACFVENCNDAAMWGHYGNKHHGICLKFKPTTSTNGQLFMRLHGINGFGGSKTKSGYTYGDRNHTFHKINYGNTPPAFDFFRSLGQLPTPTLLRDWYNNENGDVSICADDMLSNEKKWRADYWDRFTKSVTTKLRDWRQEEEYRLTLHGIMIDYSDKTRRKLKYNFNDLDGIIFGIKTPEDSKISIIKIIEEKCKLENRDGFNFYQAYYSQKTGRIENAPLTLLKPKK